MMGGWERWNER